MNSRTRLKALDGLDFGRKYLFFNDQGEVKSSFQKEIIQIQARSADPDDPRAGAKVMVFELSCPGTRSAGRWGGPSVVSTYPSAISMQWQLHPCYHGRHLWASQKRNCEAYGRFILDDLYIVG